MNVTVSFSDASRANAALLGIQVVIPDFHGSVVCDGYSQGFVVDATEDQLSDLQSAFAMLNAQADEHMTTFQVITPARKLALN